MSGELINFRSDSSNAVRQWLLSNMHTPLTNDVRRKPLERDSMDPSTRNEEEKQDAEHNSVISKTEQCIATVCRPRSKQLPTQLETTLEYYKNQPGRIDVNAYPTERRWTANDVPLDTLHMRATHCCSSIKPLPCMQRVNESRRSKSFRYPGETMNYISPTRQHKSENASICATSVHHKIADSTDRLYSADSLPLEDCDKHQWETSQVQKHNFRLSSFLRSTQSGSDNCLQRSARMIKAASDIDLQRGGQKTDIMVRRTRSKEPCTKKRVLAHSLSLNLDKFLAVKRESLSSQTDAQELRMYLNDQTIHRGSHRRRSFLPRMCTYVNSDIEETDHGTECASVSDIVNFSPKVTRVPMFVEGRLMDDFRVTYETDSFQVPSIYGQIKVMFQFFNDSKEFQVTILKGSNIAGRKTGTLGVYTKICLMPGKIQLQVGSDKHNARDPVFYEPFIFRISLDELLEREMRIKLYNKPGIFSFTEPIGECSVPLYPYDLTAVTVIWQNLNRCKGQKVSQITFRYNNQK